MNNGASQRSDLIGVKRFSKPVLFSVVGYPPMHGGTCVIMKNLLDGLSRDSVVLTTMKPLPEIEADGQSDNHQRHFVLNMSRQSDGKERLRRLLLRPLMTRRIIRLARDFGCGAIVGVHPDIAFLDAAERAAFSLRLPFFAYLHDTLAEAMSGGKFRWWGRRTQDRVFRRARSVMVATGGMASFYEQKYGLSASSIFHIYPEPIRSEMPAAEPSRKAGFWGGAVYSINAAALRRVHQTLNAAGLGFTVATGQRPDEIYSMGFEPGNVSVTSVPVHQRARYLELMADHMILVLALNWPDETHVHEDELATIFPTKTPEYLASGRPIIVHCPEHYYLARFFREFGCGVVVSDRSGDALAGAVGRIRDSEEYREELGRKALLAARMFSPEMVRPGFIEVVEAALSSGKGEPGKT